MHPAPILPAQFPHAVQKCDDIRIIRIVTAVVFLRDTDNRFHHIREAAATAATLGKRVIDLGRDDELPGIGVE
jgi:hypothetical protein